MNARWCRGMLRVCEREAARGRREKGRKENQSVRAGREEDSGNDWSEGRGRGELRKSHLERVVFLQHLRDIGEGEEHPRMHRESSQKCRSQSVIEWSDAASSAAACAAATRIDMSRHLPQ